ncbi:hypothetical protein DBV15_09541 [Temnothorax longispinosus]|uniref:Uncharacterized protein n=1 Tax=Temnothorax longispinosus TaxID=300112 RepID=A0A4S2KW08_9HYME|nr:hypothetical protein DBV15_09541 [Temnothorax longispinosus]
MIAHLCDLAVLGKVLVFSVEKPTCDGASVIRVNRIRAFSFEFFEPSFHPILKSDYVDQWIGFFHRSRKSNHRTAAITVKRDAKTCTLIDSVAVKIATTKVTYSAEPEAVRDANRQAPKTPSEKNRGGPRTAGVLIGTAALSFRKIINLTPIREGELPSYPRARKKIEVNAERTMRYYEEEAGTGGGKREEVASASAIAVDSFGQFGAGTLDDALCRYRRHDIPMRHSTALVSFRTCCHVSRHPWSSFADLMVVKSNTIRSAGDGVASYSTRRRPTTTTGRTPATAALVAVATGRDALSGARGPGDDSAHEGMMAASVRARERARPRNSRYSLPSISQCATISHSDGRGESSATISPRFALRERRERKTKHLSHPRINNRDRHGITGLRVRHVIRGTSGARLTSTMPGYFVSSIFDDTNVVVRLRLRVDSHNASMANGKWKTAKVKLASALLPSSDCSELPLRVARCSDYGGSGGTRKGGLRETETTESIFALLKLNLSGCLFLTVLTPTSRLPSCLPGGACANCQLLGS